MPLNSSIVGRSTETQTCEVDNRWLMAYAASLGDTLPCYLDTCRPESIIAHPLFSVCFQWPVCKAMRDGLTHGELTRDEIIREVHATHDVVLHRPIRPGDQLATRATVALVEQRKPGAYMVGRIETADPHGNAVCTSWYGIIYRGVSVAGANRQDGAIPELEALREVPIRPRVQIRIPIGANFAHVYTECARIWNPVHTDLAVAKAAGLPGIILHGTATLALAVSHVIEAEAPGHPERVRRIAGRFSGMVLMPSEITLRILAQEEGSYGERLHFEVLNATGERAIRDGLIELD